MNTLITCRLDLNKVVAWIVCPIPPDTTLVSSYGAAAWWWRPSTRLKGGGWEPANFCESPAANTRLKEVVRGMGVRIHMDDCHTELGTVVTLIGAAVSANNTSLHTNEFIALCLAVCRGCGLKLKLEPGWDQR